MSRRENMDSNSWQKKHTHVGKGKIQLTEDSVRVMVLLWLLASLSLDHGSHPLLLLVLHLSPMLQCILHLGIPPSKVSS
jgi:hypothetical protein